MRKACGYIRVSSEKQEKGTSLEDQKEKIEKCCKDKGYDLIHIYQDVLSGATMKDRPQYMQMMADARKKEFEILVCTKIDRLGRSLLDILNSIEELTNVRKINLVATDQQIDTSGVTGKILITVLSLVADIERTFIKERTQAGRMRKWEAGECNLGSIPFGYKKVLDAKGKPTGGIEIDDETGATYKKMINLYLYQRMSLADVAIQLNKEGLKCPGVLRAKNKPCTATWSPQACHHIMRNPVYQGVATYNKIARDAKGRKMTVDRLDPTKGESSPEKEKVRRTGGIDWVYKDKTKWLEKELPPLITKRQWNQIQARLNQKRRRPLHQSEFYKDHFLLSGILHCGECGSLMTKLIRLSTVDGKPRLYQYLCNRHGKGPKDKQFYKQKTCALKRCDALTVDNEAWNQITRLLANPSKYASAWLKDDNLDDLNAKRANLEIQLRDIEAKITKGMAYIMTVEDPDRRAKYEKTQRELEGQSSEVSMGLQKITESLDLLSHRTKRLEEFKKGMAEYMGFKSKMLFMIFLDDLSFADKRRIVEGIISPESGGKVEVSYLRPKDFLPDEELDGMSMARQLRPDKERLAVNLSFEVDPDKIMRVIGSLNKGALIDGTYKAEPDRPDDPKRFTGKRQARHFRGDGR